MRYKYILLDWDGNLADTLGLWFNAYKATAKFYNVEFADEKIPSLFGRWDVFEKFGAKNSVEFNEVLIGFASKESENTQLFPTVYETLEKLHETGRKLAIVTTNTKPLVESIVKNTGLDKFIDVIIAAEDVTKHKPDPEPVIKALEKLSGDPKQAVIVGDSDKDINAGKNAGIKTILHIPEANRKIYSEAFLNSLKPDFQISLISELLNFV